MRLFFKSGCDTEVTIARPSTARGGVAPWPSWGSSYRTWAAETGKDRGQYQVYIYKEAWLPGPAG